MLKTGEPFAMAGIYARGETEDDPVTLAILTTKANELIASIAEDWDEIRNEVDGRESVGRDQDRHRLRVPLHSRITCR
jgi:hypothetical protein